MSAFQDYRQAFWDDLARANWRTPADLPGKWRMLLPEHLQARWLRKFWSPACTRPTGIYCNRFMVGADPEFYFHDAGGGRLDANSLGLKAGLAFGADNNGRLAELRPQPAHSTLEVTASIGAELRWLSWCKPTLSAYEWRSGAHNGHDGLGGHIHFGRKRPTRDQETRALDTLAFWLFQAGIFDQAAGRNRVQRTRGHGNYGALTDVRRQTHGWEYRTLPSWIDSPWLAFFTLTLSKLVVFNPDLLPRLARSLESESVGAVRGHLEALLAHYQYRDADAALCYAILKSRGFPHFDPSDFRPRWGLFAMPPGLELPQVIPGFIPAHASEVAELSSALLEGRAPDPVNSTPTWAPSTLPSGYQYLPDITETFHAPGLGELVVGLATHTAGMFVIASPATQSARIWLGTCWQKCLGPDWLRKCRARFPDYDFATSDSSQPTHLHISTGADWKRDSGRFREWLLSGLFPVWRVEEVTGEANYNTWHNAAKKSKPEQVFSKQL